MTTSRSRLTSTFAAANSTRTRPNRDEFKAALRDALLASDVAGVATLLSNVARPQCTLTAFLFDTSQRRNYTSAQRAERPLDLPAGTSPDDFEFVSGDRAWLPLHFAASRLDKPMIFLLLERGFAAHWMFAINSMDDALECAKAAGCNDMAIWHSLFRTCLLPRDTKPKALFFAAKFGVRQLLASYLDRGADANEACGCLNAIHVAASYESSDHLECVRLLVNHGAVVDKTVLLAAAKDAAVSAATLRELATMCKNVNDVYYKTYIGRVGSLLCSASSPDKARVLLAAGASTSLALHCAAEQFDVELAKVVLAEVSDCDLEERDADNQTPLMYALRRIVADDDRHDRDDREQQQNMIALLVACGAKCDQKVDDELIRRVRRVRASLVRDRAFEICVALQSMELPALLTIMLIDATCQLSHYVPMHVKWQFATTVKHFGRNAVE